MAVKMKEWANKTPEQLEPYYVAPPWIELTLSTWDKDTQGLYDYEDKTNKEVYFTSIMSRKCVIKINKE